MPQLEGPHVSPPRKINPSPAVIVCAAAVPVAVGILGMCAHGDASVVPELESDPAAEMKKQLVTPRAASEVVGVGKVEVLARYVELVGQAPPAP